MHLLVLYFKFLFGFPQCTPLYHCPKKSHSHVKGFQKFDLWFDENIHEKDKKNIRIGLTISFSSQEKLLHSSGNISVLECSSCDSQVSRCLIRKCAVCMAAKSNSKGLPVDLSECISFAAATIALRTTWKKRSEAKIQFLF